ncbi:U-box domain-containing protein 29-like [Neltuma alba]|uniref:U-box domain-containing protein 29-like n=1 Tax=Neltuma alba TaxID=207710 RepID=UPI0010A3E983|nr:U-box domain-containing protein 29-like [Prosopis alba]
MVRDDLYITISSFFWCPISLGIKKSLGLIQILSDSVSNRVESTNSLATRTVPSPNHVVDSMKYLDGQGEHRLNSLTRIVYFAKESEENREFLMILDGFVPLLVDLLDNVNGILKKLMVKNHDNCLASLLLLLQQGSVGAKMGSTRILKFIVVDAKFEVMITEKEEHGEDVFSNPSWQVAGAPLASAASVCQNPEEHAEDESATCESEETTWRPLEGQP